MSKMKLLGWVHCKLKHNSKSGWSKGSSACFLLPSSWDDQKDNEKPNNNFDSVEWNQGKESNLYLDRYNAEETGDEFEGVFDETFPGFLAIGTLSIDPIGTEPATPTFIYPTDETSQADTEDTINDIAQINNQLEKFLKAEAQEEEAGESTISSGASSITLTEKEVLQISKDFDVKEFPLQQYLFGSPVDVSETKEKARKERVTLHDIFQRSKGEGEPATDNSEKKLEPAIKTHKEPGHMMRRILLKLQCSPKQKAGSFNEKTKNPTSGDGASTKSLKTSSKFKKIKQLFQKKVHPEGNRTVKDVNTLINHEMRSPNNNTRNNREKTKQEIRQLNHAVGTNAATDSYYTLEESQDEMKWIKCFLRSKENRSSSISEEHWIKTDANFLVLELRP